MTTPIQRSAEVFRVHPIILWGAVFASLLLQAFLPTKIPLTRLFDFPLLTLIYFAVLRRDKLFAIGLGTAVGLLQDALSHGYIGIFGMAKAIVGYLAASASIKFDLDQTLSRSTLTAALVVAHALSLFGLERILLEPPPPFAPLNMASGVLVNAGLGLILFQLLDQLRKPA